MSPSEQEATRRLRASLSRPPSIRPPPDLEQILRERQEALRFVPFTDDRAMWWRLLGAWILSAALLAAVFFVIGFMVGKYLA